MKLLLVVMLAATCWGQTPPCGGAAPEFGKSCKARPKGCGIKDKSGSYEWQCVDGKWAITWEEKIDRDELTGSLWARIDALELKVQMLEQAVGTQGLTIKLMLDILESLTKERDKVVDKDDVIL